jgi:hypothetical protein
VCAKGCNDFLDQYWGGIRSYLRFRSFLQPLQTHVRILSRLDHSRFFPNPFQHFFLPVMYLWTLDSLQYQQ